MEKKLKPEIIEKVRRSRECVTRLMLQNDCSERTVSNWCNTNHRKLNCLNNLSVISVSLQIPLDLLQQEQPEQLEKTEAA